MRFNFSSPLDMGRVTDKYIEVGNGDGEGKTRSHPAPLPCLMWLFMGVLTQVNVTFAFHQV